MLSPRTDYSVQVMAARRAAEHSQEKILNWCQTTLKRVFLKHQSRFLSQGPLHGYVDLEMNDGRSVSEGRPENFVTLSSSGWCFSTSEADRPLSAREWTRGIPTCVYSAAGSGSIEAGSSASRLRSRQSALLFSGHAVEDRVDNEVLEGEDPQRGPCNDWEDPSTL